MITTIHPGSYTTVQDEGRWGYQAFGMPVAGVMDHYAARIANLLAGNKPSAAVLEMTMKGGHFRFEQDSCAAVCGADMQAKLNGAPVQNWSSFIIPAGSELTFDYAADGCRTYLAVTGGIDVPVVLGSRSTYTRGAVGGVEGRALKAGDMLPVGTDNEYAAQVRELAREFVPVYGEHIGLRVLLGPQDDHFTAAGIQTLFNSTYTISTEADRMGYRLEGNAIQHNDKADIISDALCLGTIQVPGNGLPIVMMADRQTTGGYTKIGTVIGPDLVHLAQAKPGDTIAFQLCSEEEARAAFFAEQQAYKRIRDSVLVGSEDNTAGPVRHLRVTVNNQVFHVNIREVK